MENNLYRQALILMQERDRILAQLSQVMNQINELEKANVAAPVA